MTPPVPATVGEEVGDGPHCSICGAPSTPALTARDRNRRLSTETFSYHRCTRCRTLQLVPVPEDLDRFYPPEYYAVPPDRAQLVAVAGPERYKLEIIRRFVAGGRLMEVGPAVGSFLVVMQEAGFDTRAIEMDARAAEFLRSELSVPVHETDDPVSALAGDDPYDVIAMWHVIEHVPNPSELLTAAASALRPGGIIALAAPNPDAAQFRALRSRWTHVDAPRHLYLIPHQVLTEIARGCGLQTALLTTADPGTLQWNRFGWRESLAGFATGRYARFLLRVLGAMVARVAAPVERRDHHGSTYTLVLRRPTDATDVTLTQPTVLERT